MRNAMRCLWLTWANPEPRHNGQFVYSGGLIEAVAGAGAAVEVLGLARPGAATAQGTSDGTVRWWLGPHESRPGWTSLLSPLPRIAHRGATRQLRGMLEQLLAESWDIIVLDGISAGWALRQVLRRYSGEPRRPKLVYVSHNHEESLRLQIAREQSNPLKRLALQLDAAKVTMLERAMVDAADLITAITEEDRRLYLQRRPTCRVEVVTPGYDGHRTDQRQITNELPRRAIILGSFDWIAKRMNLEEFVTVADPLFAAQGAELQVVGSAEEAFLQKLRRKAVATRFTGRVDDVDSFMRQARVALVPERHGGGFKLKVLDYVFNRMPILALDGSVAGVPLRHEESILYYPDYEALARGVLRVIDDCERLNGLQDQAFSACSNAFDWGTRGRQLMSAVAAL